MKYNNKWFPNSLNIDFWNEVLVGRCIVSLSFNENGMVSFKLDSGEEVKLVGDQGTLMVEV